MMSHNDALDQLSAHASDSYNNSVYNDDSQLSAILSRGARELGVSLSDYALGAFETYCSFLSERNRSVNLTAISGVEDVARLHFLDSIALLNACSFTDKQVIDIGSGAGFPGLPLKITEPSIKLTMLDATGKRVDFLSDLCGLLQLDAICLHARAEEAAHNQDLRESYDIVLSRAVAGLNVLCEICLPFTRPGGLFIAMKSAKSDDELVASLNAIATLGGTPGGCFDYEIPETGIIHRAVIIHKTAHTLEIYPRRFAKIQKSPL